MKLSAIFAVVFMFMANEAVAQRRPRPRPMPVPPRRPVPAPPRRPVPIPVPRPVPPSLVCVGADLYQHNWLIHRFRWINDCHQGLQDLRFRGRFCDNGALFNNRGHFLRQYSNQFECRNWLKR